MRVSELMGTEIILMYEGETVKKAIDLMAKKSGGIITVINNITDKKVIGIITSKDIINRVVSQNINPVNIPLSYIMTKGCISINPFANTSDAISLIVENNIKRILVMNGDSLDGIITSNDIIKGMLKYKKSLLDLAIRF